MSEKIRAHIFVSGRVQGVFFRDHTRKKAKELGVFGWVRNLSDDRVEAVFEGEKEKLEEMIDWVRQGPSFAKVDRLSVTRDEYKGEFENFEVR